jgi:hypothetical protein
MMHVVAPALGGRKQGCHAIDKASVNQSAVTKEAKKLEIAAQKEKGVKPCQHYTTSK